LLRKKGKKAILVATCVGFAILLLVFEE
jgi:hypothetical protein